MYRIKAKEKYNVILKDIGINLKAENTNWIEVPKELLDNSKDAKALAAFFIKEDVSVKVDVSVKEIKKIEKIEKKEETVFIAHKPEEKPLNGVFVSQPKGEEVEQISEEKETKILDSVEVVEIPTVEKVTEVEEVEPAVESVVETVVKEDKQPKATPKASSKTTNKKVTPKK